MLYRQVISDLCEIHKKQDLVKMQWSRTKYAVGKVTTVFEITYSWQKVKL